MPTKRSAPSDRLPPRRRVEVTRPHPAAWEEALARAGGDARRLEPQPDGSVLIRNYRVR